MSDELTWRQKTVLAALASDPGAQFAPVQVQKLFFLIDENIADDIGGRLFGFEPYDYGPFDKAVYDELEALEQMGLVEIINRHLRGGRRFRLTHDGQAAGDLALKALSGDAAGYIKKVSRWVQSLSFSALVGSIYKAYPAMKANSIFRT